MIQKLSFMNRLIVFDLDDTLYKEIDFLKSAYKEISENINSNDKFLFESMMEWYSDKKDVFQILSEKFNMSKLDLVNIYRNHYPKELKTDINLPVFLKKLSKNNKLGIITDGRSITQRNKLKSLKIEKYFDLIVISEEFGSEKPNENNFTIFEQFENTQKYYVGDNINKDFICPNKLGWTTFCLLDNEDNIHKQNFDIENNYLPQINIKSLLELGRFI